MKILVYLTMGALLACPILANAQSTNAAPSGGGDWGGGHHMKFLSDADKAELKKAHDAAVAANPDLETQMKDVMTQMKAAHDAGNEPSDDLKQKAKSLHEQMDAAMVKADPAVAPILAKIKAHHHGPGGGPGGNGAGGPPPPPDSGT